MLLGSIQRIHRIRLLIAVTSMGWTGAVALNRHHSDTALIAGRVSAVGIQAS